jgi:hypothetical protein
MDSRQYGKNIPGCLNESARPSLSFGVGLFCCFGIPIGLVMAHPSRSPLTIALLCLCLCSLFLAPVFHVLGTAMPEVAEFDSELTEYEEDLLIAFGERSTFASAMTSGRGITRLNIHPASLSPAFLPPKHSSN